MTPAATHDPIRIVLIGAGRMGGHHARRLAGRSDCRLVAVVDSDAGRAQKLASECGAAAVARLADVTAAYDAVTVAVPTSAHEAVALPLIERRLPVLIEKPLAPDAAGSRRLVEAAKRHDCLLQVGHSERFNPVVQAMVRMEVTPRFIETHRIAPFSFRSADIGVVMDLMIHDIDVVLHLVRCYDYRVDAVGVSVLSPHEDVANARVRFANGCVVNMTASRVALKVERKIRVFSPTAYLTMDYQKKTGLAVKLADNLDLIRMARERNAEDLSQMQDLDWGSMVKVEELQMPDPDTDALTAEYNAFFTSIRTGAAAAVSAEEGFRAVELAERITASLREHEWRPDLA